MARETVGRRYRVRTTPSSTQSCVSDVAPGIVGQPEPVLLMSVRSAGRIYWHRGSIRTLRYSRPTGDDGHVNPPRVGPAELPCRGHFGYFA